MICQQHSIQRMSSISPRPSYLITWDCQHIMRTSMKGWARLSNQQHSLPTKMNLRKQSFGRVSSVIRCILSSRRMTNFSMFGKVVLFQWHIHTTLVLDENYQPRTKSEKELFQEMQFFMYTAFEAKLKLDKENCLSTIMRTHKMLRQSM
jgi:hypothetical protein